MKILTLDVPGFVATGMMFAILANLCGFWKSVLIYVALVVIGNILKVVVDLISSVPEK